MKRLHDLLKPELDRETYTKLKNRVRELSDGLENLQDGEEFKAMFYLSELEQVGKQWATILIWPNENLVSWAKKAPFEYGNNTGRPIQKKTTKCPQCGLTPLTKVTKYCITCEKYVIFNHTDNEFTPVIQVTDELIITSDYNSLRQ